MNNKEFADVLGQDLQRYQFENGVVFVYRQPTTSEFVRYKNSVQIRRQGKAFSTKAAEQQLELADRILVDVEKFGYVGADGKQKALDKNTKSDDLAHFKIDGKSPKNWKEAIILLRPPMMFQFIESVLAGMEEEEKN